MDDEVTEILVKRAKEAGYKAICLTVDTPVGSPKERDVRNLYMAQPGLHWGSLRDRPDLINRRNVGVPDLADWAPPDYVGLTWDRLDWLRDLTGLPSSLRASALSRTLSSAPSTALTASSSPTTAAGSSTAHPPASRHSPPSPKRSATDWRYTSDSGVRRGLDVLKALCLGARAVLVGRPLYWGLAYGGADGVEHMLKILQVEFDRALAYVGCRTPDELHPGIVDVPDTDWWPRN